MGLTCKRVRHKARRDRDQNHSTISYCDTESVDCSSNSILLQTVRRQQYDNTDQYVRQTNNDKRIQTNATIALQLRDDSDDIIDDSLENMDDETMVECNRKIEKTILSNRRKLLTPIMPDQLKCDGDSHAHKMSSSNMKTTTIVCRCECETMSKFSAIFAAPFWFAGTNTISRFIHMINFKRKTANHHRIFTLPPSHTELETIAPTKIQPTNNNNNKNQNKVANKSEHESKSDNTNTNSSKKCDEIKNIYSKGHNNRSIISSSQCFIRQSVCLYAASGFLIALCFLAVPATASIDSLHPM